MKPSQPVSSVVTRELYCVKGFDRCTNCQVLSREEVSASPETAGDVGAPDLCSHFLGSGQGQVVDSR